MNSILIKIFLIFQLQFSLNELSNETGPFIIIINGKRCKNYMKANQAMAFLKFISKQLIGIT